MSQETKQIFSIRKFKTGTHSALLAKYGLALVSAAILMGAAGAVSADEVTTPTNPTVTLTANPATNLETAQAAPSEANQATTQASGTQTGTLTNEVTSASLDTAVSAAQDAGVTVSKEASVTHDSLSKAQADLASQETSLKEVTAKAEANTKAINDAKATNAQIDAENQAEKERVEALNKAGEEETNQRNIRNEQAVNARNAQLQAEYNKLLEEYNAAIKTNEAIEAANATAKKEADEQNAKNLKEYQEKLAQYYDAIASIANNAATDTSFSSDDLKKFLLSSSGQNPLYVIGEKGAEITADLSHLETLSDSERQDYLNRVKQVFSDDSANAKTEVRIAEENIADSHLYKLKVGDTITYNGAVSGEGVITKATVTNITGTENGFITANVDTNAIGFNSHDTGGTMSIRLDFIKDGRPAQGSYIVGFGDVDWLQGVSFSKQPTAILYGKSIHEISGHYDAISDVGIEGSDLAEGQVWALFDNVDSVEFTYHDNSEMVKKQPLTQRGSAWYFAVGGVTLGVDNIFRYPTPPIPDEVTPKQLVPVPETPIQPELESFTPETYTPVTPTVKPHVAVPEKESFSVAVHPVFVTQTPTNVKDVVDTDTVSTNGHLVPKGSIQTWTLTNEGLKAGRDRVTSFVMTDPLPSGFVIDRDATAKANADAWTVAYKEDGKLELVATDSTLAALNA
ncbi:YSIRK-type signal peptide-containing protein, partial [Streptococcus suis]|nr:YSIRK-type signal peptide-containing protein [Streptococcus suis]